MEENDLIEKIEDYTHNVGYSQRGGEAIEPYLSDQWFVKMKPLAEIALKPVQDGRIQFHPNHWVKTYEHWMNNIRDWCISRQLWWGHRIPVYYTEDGQQTVAATEQAAREKLGLPADTPLRQDEDVLDTWFSSWLWPLTTMNWLSDGKTEDSPELNTYLPTDLMVTAPDIIFFWVSRMIMASMKFRNEIPFKDVYFTSMIRDGKGRKLSKSLGNSPDPLNIIEKYGTDANRFTIIYLSPLGQDVKMDVDVKAQDIPSMEIGRNFANKIWNAGRFLLMKLDMEGLADSCPSNQGKSLNPDELSFSDKWILSRMNSTIRNIHTALDNYKVNDYSKILYDFIWRDFCDWYVEIIKVQLNRSDSPAYKQALMNHAIHLYEEILKLLHPVMPFITEEIWHLLDDRNEDESISLQKVPEPDEKFIDITIEEKFAGLQLLVEEIRRLRATLNLPPQQKVPIIISSKNSEAKSFISAQADIIAAMGNCSKVKSEANFAKPQGCLASVVRETEIFLMLEGTIDIDKEKERLDKEIQRLENNIRGTEKKLSNEKFVNNASSDVVQHEREKLESMQESLKKVVANLGSLR
ncbi:class I tRNA ligase family protein [Bacteroidota bacterium]